MNDDEVKKIELKLSDVGFIFEFFEKLVNVNVGGFELLSSRF